QQQRSSATTLRLGTRGERASTGEETPEKEKEVGEWKRRSLSPLPSPARPPTPNPPSKGREGKRKRPCVPCDHYHRSIMGRSSSPWIRWRSIIVVMVLIVMTMRVEAKEQKRCPEMCPSSCPDEDSLAACKESSVMDECGCCPVCVLHRVGAACGPAAACAPPLLCAARNESAAAKCVEADSMEACADVECPIPFHPRCPDDSRLVIRAPEKKGECCGRRGECVCDEESCSVPSCDVTSGLQRVLIKEGAGVAGQCCDKYECRKREAHCATALCPPSVLHENEGEEECPTDSHRPPIHRTEGACCPVQPGCRCRASICKPATCPEGKIAKVTKRGSGTPGSCCDEWTCVEEPTTLMKGCLRAGQKYKDGEEWHEGSCETCRCKRGVAACSKQSCPKPHTQCSWIVLPEGECCPVCYGCQTERLEKKRMNETWQRDDCTTCTCSPHGESVCEKHMCRSDCENPRKVEGQCCPVCDEPTILTLPSTCPSLEHCPLRCENGLSRDDRGCFVCACLPAVAPEGEGRGEGKKEGTTGNCKSLDETNCEKQCAHGYLRNAAGCAVCRCAKCPPLHQCIKHCLYGFETNSVGCPVCKCRAMARIDARLSIADKLSRLSGKDKCVSVSSTGKIIERDGGEWWSDGCRHCFCEQHQEFCSLISCPERPAECPESAWTHEDGACCPSCSSSLVTTAIESSTALSTGKSLAAKHEHTVCQSPGTGRLFTDGETWQLAPCVSCTCRVGHVLCRVAECPPTPCKEPLLIGGGGQCCPQCPKDPADDVNDDSAEACTDGSGLAHASGGSWRNDDCTSCVCRDGKEECFKQTCDDLASCRGVPLVLKGRCCPVCSDVLSSSAVCTYGNAVYSVHEEWRDGTCRNCSCVAGGQTVCRELVCPACADPVSVSSPDACCPLCKDGGWASFGEGNGSIVLPSSSTSTPSPMTVVALSLGGTVLLLMLLALILFLYRKRKATHKVIGSPGGRRGGGVLSKVNSSGVLLTAASKRLGSHPQLPLISDDWEGMKMGVVTESLLGTNNSECSASVASSESSGHGTAGSHSADDLAPLTRSPGASRRPAAPFGALVDFAARLSTPTASPKTPRHHQMNP
ncbi:hypothetical protein PFISCL1PPCAC_2894, partial [Pristionchus fissidentatus]